MIEAGTLSDLEEYLSAEFKKIFAGRTFTNNLGHSVTLNTFVHSLPIKQGNDEEPEDADLPEPYIVAEITGGKRATPDDPHMASVAVIICVCDDNTARQGHKDVLDIIYHIITRFEKNPVLAGKFVLQYPLDWSLSDEDTYPYYYGGLLMNFEVAAIQKEDELA